MFRLLDKLLLWFAVLFVGGLLLGTLLNLFTAH